MAEMKFDIKKVIDGAIKEFKHQGYNVSKWISVNDKLPEQDEKVLVLTKDKDIMTMIYKEIPFRWYKPKFGGFDKDYVTHWKPLKESDTE